MIDALRIPLLLVHLSLAHWAAWGPLWGAACVWSRRSNVRNLGKQTSISALLALLGAGLLGSIALVLCFFASPQEPFSLVMANLPRFRWWMIALEWLASLLLMLGAWPLLRGERIPGSSKVLATLLLLAASTNLLYHFPMFFAACHTAAEGISTENVKRLPERLTTAGLKQIRFSPQVLSLTCHHLLAGLAWSGIVFAQFGVKHCERRRLSNLPTTSPRQFAQGSTLDSAALNGAKLHEGGDLADHGSETMDAPQDAMLHAAAWGGRAALFATLAQVLVGLWTATQLPLSDRNALLGGKLPITILFCTGILASVVLLHSLANLALMPNRDTTRWAAICWAGVTLLMLFVNAWLRG